MDPARIYHLPTDDGATPPQGPDEAVRLIEDYLDHLCAPLVGVVPYEDRMCLRMEADEHLSAKMQLYINDGIEPVDAALKAIHQYGTSQEMAEAYLEEWMRHLPKGTLANKIGLPNAFALLFFGQATMIGEILVQIRLYHPNPDPVLFGLSLPELRQIIPEPFPLPDRNPTWILFWAYAFLAPILAGWFTGRTALVGAAKAVLQVQICLTLLTFILGTAMLPTQEGLWLALVMVFWWVPIGALLAHVASALQRRRRLRFRPTRRKKS